MVKPFRFIQMIAGTRHIGNITIVQQFADFTGFMGDRLKRGGTLASYLRVDRASMGERAGFC